MPSSYLMVKVAPGRNQRTTPAGKVVGNPQMRWMYDVVNIYAGEGNWQPGFPAFSCLEFPDPNWENGTPYEDQPLGPGRTWYRPGPGILWGAHPDGCCVVAKVPGWPQEYATLLEVERNPLDGEEELVIPPGVHPKYPQGLTKLLRYPRLGFRKKGFDFKMTGVAKRILDDLMDGTRNREIVDHLASPVDFTQWSSTSGEVLAFAEDRASGTLPKAEASRRPGTGLLREVL